MRETPTPLLQRRCVPCEAGTPPLTPEQAEALLAQISSRWKLAADARSLERRVVFRDFRSAMDFLNQLADLAEEEGHHPDFCCSYRTVDLRLTTHAIQGLSENDFILAAKIDALLRRRQEARHAG
jgi:4a-hydroxytetrahydrobiopterin dehydratase